MLTKEQAKGLYKVNEADKTIEMMGHRFPLLSEKVVTKELVGRYNAISPLLLNYRSEQARAKMLYNLRAMPTLLDVGAALKGWGVKEHTLPTEQHLLSTQVREAIGNAFMAAKEGTIDLPVGIYVGGYDIYSRQAYHEAGLIYKHGGGVVLSKDGKSSPLGWWLSVRKEVLYSLEQDMDANTMEYRKLLHQHYGYLRNLLEANYHYHEGHLNGD